MLFHFFFTLFCRPIVALYIEKRTFLKNINSLHCILFFLFSFLIFKNEYLTQDLAHTGLDEI